MNAYSIIRRPVITEKSTRQKERYNQFTFEVLPSANKIEIARAVERIFKVRVRGVRTVNITGKIKRRGRWLGKRRNWKKAIVTLARDARIEFFDGV